MVIEMDPRLRKHLGETGQLGNSARRKDYGSGLGHTSRKPQNLWVHRLQHQVVAAT